MISFDEEHGTYEEPQVEVTEAVPLSEEEQYIVDKRVLRYELFHMQEIDENCDQLGIMGSQAEIERVLETGLADQVLLEGLEFEDPLRDSYFGGRRHQFAFTRALQNNPELFTAIGYEDRETSFSDSSLPLSEVIAYFGVDVVVADSMSSHIDPRNIQEFQAERMGMDVDEMVAFMREKRVKKED